MFFSVALEPDNKFPNQQQAGKFWFNSDNGWLQQIHDQTVTFYKGYQDNFCQVTVAPDMVTLQHNEFRTFPLWYKFGCVTNLCGDGLEQAWANIELSMNSTGQVTVTKQRLNLDIADQPLEVWQAVDQIKAILDRTAQEFKQNNPQNVKFYVSGGCDTMLLYVMACAHNLDFELLTNSHYEFDSFTTVNQNRLKQFWAYKQIHHWLTPTWLATGSCGDEYFLRGPAAIAQITAWHDIDFQQELESNSQAYHYHYFKKYTALWSENWQDRARLKKLLPTRNALNQWVLNSLANDHQHWHLGHTLTWTPFHNLDIVKILLQLDITDLMGQFVDATISKQLIARYDTRAVDYISTYKNVNSQENIKKLLENQ